LTKNALAGFNQSADLSTYLRKISVRTTRTAIAAGPILMARDRMRAKFVRIVTRFAKQLEHLQRWDEVVSLYLRSLEREPGEESLHRGLIHARRGEEQDKLASQRREIVLSGCESQVNSRYGSG
jgi:hypothetical protein